MAKLYTVKASEKRCKLAMAKTTQTDDHRLVLDVIGTMWSPPLMFVGL